MIFPHHENEIAQSEACNDEKFANYWMHNGFLNIDNKKMSKSAGNFFTVREIGEKYPLQVIRFFMLSAHYRTPLNFSDKRLVHKHTFQLFLVLPEQILLFFLKVYYISSPSYPPVCIDILINCSF